MTSSIAELLEYGPIVFCDDVMKVVITINGSYLNWWVKQPNGEFNNVDCRGYDGNLYDLTVAKAMTLAENWFKEEMNPDIIDDVKSTNQYH